MVNLVQGCEYIEIDTLNEDIETTSRALTWRSFSASHHNSKGQPHSRNC